MNVIKIFLEVLIHVMMATLLSKLFGIFPRDYMLMVILAKTVAISLELKERQ